MSQTYDNKLPAILRLCLYFVLVTLKRMHAMPLDKGVIYFDVYSLGMCAEGEARTHAIFRVIAPPLISLTNW
jgi:hypothetical protein